MRPPPRTAEGATFAEMARTVGHDYRTCQKALGAGRIAKHRHGGARRDVLGHEGRLMLDKLTTLFPRVGDQW